MSNGFGTIQVQGGTPHGGAQNTVAVPIYQTAAFTFGVRSALKGRRRGK